MGNGEKDARAFKQKTNIKDIQDTEGRMIVKTKKEISELLIEMSSNIHYEEGERVLELNEYALKEMFDVKHIVLR